MAKLYYFFHTVNWGASEFRVIYQKLSFGESLNNSNNFPQTRFKPRDENLTISSMHIIHLMSDELTRFFNKFQII